MDINQNLGNLMKEAQKMQERMKEAQKQLSQLVIMGKAANGIVTVKMNGKHEVLETVINPSLMEEDVDMLAALVTAAFNDAVSKVEQASKEKISQLTAGLNIPTNFRAED